jgi:hypothetical protein
MLSALPLAFCFMQYSFVVVLVEIAWKPSSFPVILDICTPLRSTIYSTPLNALYFCVIQKQKQSLPILINLNPPTLVVEILNIMLSLSICCS